MQREILLNKQVSKQTNKSAKSLINYKPALSSKQLASKHWVCLTTKVLKNSKYAFKVFFTQLKEFTISTLDLGRTDL